MKFRKKVIIIAGHLETYQSLTIGFYKNTTKTIKAKQGDNDTRFVLITFLDNNGKTVNIDDSMDLEFKMVTPNNKSIYHNDCLTVQSDGKVLITLDDNMLASAGTARAELSIIKDKKVLSTTYFRIIIEKSIVSASTIIATNDFAILRETLDSAREKETIATEAAERAEGFADEAKTQANIATTKANAAATSETNAANSATSAANSANTATTKANTATTKASEAATSATNAANSASTASNKASEASTSATNAANSATSAANSATSSEQSATASAESALESAESATEASASASASKKSEENAKTSETIATEQANISTTKATEAGNAAISAQTSEENALNSSILAKSYAVGETGTRTGEDTDNAKYYSLQAKKVSEEVIEELNKKENSSNKVTSIGNNPTDNQYPSAKAVKDYVESLPEPMIFKGSLGTNGTITTLPSASSSNEGFTYKVITTGTYASQSAKVGDTFISDGTNWVLIPSGDEPSGTVTSVGLEVPNGMKVSNSPITTSGNISISMADGYSIPTDTEQDNWDSAYTHSKSTHARTDATKVEKSTTNGNVLINGVETNVYTHPGGTNPHGTTASDIGLGNVPNVETNDQTVTYTESTTLAKLTSGEKLSIAFGKISKAVTDLISHLADTVKHITSTERTNWNAAKTHADSAHAPSNAQANVIETVKVNGTALTPSSKAVDIAVPTKVSQITNDSGYLTTHPSISTSTDSTSTASPSAGGTFTAVDSVTRDSNGHVTKVNTKTVTLPNTAITVDSALSSTSTNPVQNKVVNAALGNKANTLHEHNYAGSSSAGGSANSALIPYGFGARSGSATWGNQIGTYVTDWNDTTGGTIQFRQNNPSSGKLSALIDGYFYQNEGQYRCLDKSDESSLNVASANFIRNYYNYATRPTSANITDAPGAVYFLASSTMTEGKPNIGDSFILHFPWEYTSSGAGNGCSAQLALKNYNDSNSPKMAIRCQASGAKWTDWKEMFGSVNFNYDDVKTSAREVISLTSKTDSEGTGIYFYVQPSANLGGFEPYNDNSLYLGSSRARWKQIYAINSSISTSDRNEKYDISYIGKESEFDTETSDELLKSFIMRMNPVVFKRTNGESGRPHHGMIAQDIEELINSLCIDHAGFIKSPATKQVEVYEVNGVEVLRKDLEGVPTYEISEEILEEYGENVTKRIEDEVIEGEYKYGLRYEEFIGDIIRFCQLLKKENDELKVKNDDLESRISKLESLIIN